MDQLPQPHPPPEAWWVHGSKPELNSYNDVVTRVRVLEKLSKESKIRPITIDDSDDELPGPSRVYVEPQRKNVVSTRVDAHAQTSSLTEPMPSIADRRLLDNLSKSPRASASRTLSPADALAALSALPKPEELFTLQKRKRSIDQPSDIDSHSNKSKLSKTNFDYICPDIDEQSSSNFYNNQSSDSDDYEDSMVNEIDPDSLTSARGSDDESPLVNSGQVIDLQPPSLDNFAPHVKETYSDENEALLHLPLRPLARQAFLLRMAENVDSNKNFKKEWFDDVFAENMNNFSFFKDEKVDRTFSQLYLNCTNLSQYMRTVIKSFWDESLFKFFHIPANLVYSNPTRSDLTPIPGYKSFHQMLSQMLRGSQVAFRWSSNASKMSSEFLNPEFNSINTDVSRTIDFQSPPVMAQMIQRARQVLQKRKYPISQYNQIPDDVQKKLAALQFFPNEQLNELFQQIITSAKSIRTAVHETALVFWSADYLRKHYLPVERQGRSSKLPPVEGYAYFFDLWNEVFNFRNDEGRKKLITNYVSALNHNMTFGEKHSRLSQIGYV